MRGASSTAIGPGRWGVDVVGKSRFKLGDFELRPRELGLRELGLQREFLEVSGASDRQESTVLRTVALGLAEQPGDCPTFARLSFVGPRFSVPRCGFLGFIFALPEEHSRNLA